MRYDKKEVDFEYYCPRCENYETVETEEPCCECLEHCFNYNTKRPVHYSKNKNYKEAK